MRIVAISEAVIILALVLIAIKKIPI